jgi:hypothetical protein
VAQSKNDENNKVDNKGDPIDDNRQNNPIILAIIARLLFLGESLQFIGDLSIFLVDFGGRCLGLSNKIQGTSKDGSNFSVDDFIFDALVDAILLAVPGKVDHNHRDYEGDAD